MGKARKLGALGILLLALFALLTVQVSAGHTTAFDQGWADSSRLHADGQPGLLVALRWLTHLGDGPFLVIVGVAATGLLLWRRRFALALLWVAVALGGHLFNSSLKHTLDRPRPALAERDVSATATNPSYPSGHTMAATISFGLLGYVYVRRGRGRRFLVLALLCAVVLLVGLSRIYLRAHWVTDVLGGFLAAGGWLAMWMGMAEVLRLRFAVVPLPAVEVGEPAAALQET